MKINELRELVNSVIAEENLKLSKQKRLKALKEAMQIFEDHMKKADVSPELAAKCDELVAALKDGKLKEVKNILNSAEFQSPEAFEILNASDASTDVVSVEKGDGVDASKCFPTQSNIFISQSAAWPLSDYNTCKYIVGGDVTVSPAARFLIINVVELSENEIWVLDGHHRWSQTFCFLPDESCLIPARNFNFADTNKQTVLGKLQVAIKANLAPAEELPKAGDKIGDRLAAMGMGPEEVSKFKSNDNALGGSAASMETGLYQCSLYHRELDSSQPLVLGDEYMQKIIADQTLHAAMGIEGLDPADLKPESELTPGDKESISQCPWRKAIIETVAKNLVKINKPISGSPDRTLMPQLDGGSLGKQGPKVIGDKLSAGEINVNEPFLEESIDLKRWNKLAGTILKD